MGKTSAASLHLAATRGPLTTNFGTVEYAYDSLDEAFPAVEPGIRPFGTYALFQIRQPKQRTKGGIILTKDDRTTEYYNTQVAKCIACGPLCFKVARSVENPKTGEAEEKLFEYAEGPWFKPGDYVRVPRYGGDRFGVTHEYVGEECGEKATIKDEIIFVIFKAKDVLALVTGDPLAVRSFYD